jgi:hypothetical protein
MVHHLEGGLKKHFDSKLVDELLAAYEHAKDNFHLGGLRLSAVEGGRFCEAAFRMLEQATTTRFTPLNKQLDTTRIISDLANLPSGQTPDSIRLHIPRMLRVIYDIRNKRDAAHLADGIDPNLQDAALVASNLDWVLGEFVRLYHDVSANEAQKLVDGVTNEITIIESRAKFWNSHIESIIMSSDKLIVLDTYQGHKHVFWNALQKRILQPKSFHLVYLILKDSNALLREAIRPLAVPPSVVELYLCQLRDLKSKHNESPHSDNKKLEFLYWTGITPGSLLVWTVGGKETVGLAPWLNLKESNDNTPYLVVHRGLFFDFLRKHCNALICGAEAIKL